MSGNLSHPSSTRLVVTAVPCNVLLILRARKIRISSMLLASVSSRVFSPLLLFPAKENRKGGLAELHSQLDWAHTLRFVLLSLRLSRFLMTNNDIKCKQNCRWCSSSGHVAPKCYERASLMRATTSCSRHAADDVFASEWMTYNCRPAPTDVADLSQDGDDLSQTGDGGGHAYGEVRT